MTHSMIKVKIDFRIIKLIYVYFFYILQSNVQNSHKYTDTILNESAFRGEQFKAL